MGESSTIRQEYSAIGGSFQIEERLEPRHLPTCVGEESRIDERGGRLRAPGA